MHEGAGQGIKGANGEIKRWPVHRDQGLPHALA